MSTDPLDKIGVGCRHCCQCPAKRLRVSSRPLTACRFMAIHGNRELCESGIAVFSKHVCASLYRTPAAVEHLLQLAIHSAC